MIFPRTVYPASPSLPRTAPSASPLVTLPYSVLQGLSSPSGGRAAPLQHLVRCAPEGAAAPHEACVRTRGEACLPAGGAGVLEWTSATSASASSRAASSS